MTVSGQVRVFLAMMLCGAGCGAVHDLLAIVRRGWLTAACADLALGLIAAAAVIAAGVVLRCDVFRLYVFAGLAAGWAFYACSLGTIVRILRKEFIQLSKKVRIRTKSSG